MANKAGGWRNNKKRIFKIKKIKTMLGPITKACTTSSNLFNSVDLQMYLNFESWLLTRNLAISRALKELVNVKAVLTFYRDPAAPAPAAHYTTHYKMVEHGKPLFQMHHSAHNTSSYSSPAAILNSQLLSTLRWHPARARDTKSTPQRPRAHFSHVLSTKGVLCSNGLPYKVLCI